MATDIIPGRAIASEIRAELRDRVGALAASGTRPGLATVLVGQDPASRVYVGMKNRAAEEAGIYSRQIDLAAETTHHELLGVVQGLNADPNIHGILVQLPVPSQIDTSAILEAIAPEKDVDGFHPVNAGRVASGLPDGFAPCTPKGVMVLLERTGIDPKGKHAVVVGRSTIVGRPMSHLLLAADATVTTTHRYTADLPSITRQADILVVAVGKPGLIGADAVRPGAVVIDVGVNRVPDDSVERGYRIVGDVDFDAVQGIASAITPVPGGVGPMTIAMLLSNTVEAAERRAAQASLTPS